MLAGEICHASLESLYKKLQKFLGEVQFAVHIFSVGAKVLAVNFTLIKSMDKFPEYFVMIRACREQQISIKMLRAASLIWYHVQ